MWKIIKNKKNKKTDININKYLYQKNQNMKRIKNLNKLNCGINHSLNHRLNNISIKSLGTYTNNYNKKRVELKILENNYTVQLSELKNKLHKHYDPFVPETTFKIEDEIFTLKYQIDKLEVEKKELNENIDPLSCYIEGYEKGWNDCVKNTVNTLT